MYQLNINLNYWVCDLKLSILPLMYSTHQISFLYQDYFAFVHRYFVLWEMKK